MDLTEGGIRVPWIAHWPARIAPGGVSAQLCMTMDWTATMLEAAGVAADPDYPLDGVSLLPLLADPSRTSLDAAAALAHEPSRASARCAWRWKYLRVDGNDYLFDLAADERERANRAQREPAAAGRNACGVEALE